MVCSLHASYYVHQGRLFYYPCFRPPMPGFLPFLRGAGAALCLAFLAGFLTFFTGAASSMTDLRTPLRQLACFGSAKNRMTCFV